MKLLERWEYGSEFSWDFFPGKEKNANWFHENSMLLGSGRCALKLLISWGRNTEEWKRIWLPTYFCPEVIEAIISTGIGIMFYSDDPIDGIDWDNFVFQNGDILLVNNLFGYRSKPSYDFLPRNAIQIIEDHSHDPWSDWNKESDADWCIGSLRKSLPISDGAFLWSPQGHQLPSKPRITADHYLASRRKFFGMLLKADYLRGMPVEKEFFREFLINGEKQLGISESSSITDFSIEQLFETPIKEIRERKKQNYTYLFNLLKDLNAFKLLTPYLQDNCCPFSVIIEFDLSTSRDFVYKSLVNRNIYPALLWQAKEAIIKHFTTKNIDFSDRMLSLHCDYRYSVYDLDRVVEIMIEITKEL